MFDPTDNESLLSIKVQQLNDKDAASPHFKILRLTGTEAISALFEFELFMVSKDPDIDMSKLVGKKITLAMRTNAESAHYSYHGVFKEFEQLQQYNDYYQYRAVLVPNVWLHTLNKINDVFTNTSILTVIKDKLSEFSLTSLDFSINPKNQEDYPKRAFIAQYEESNFSFLSRSMEYAGLYYYFAHGNQAADKEILTIIDDSLQHPAETLNLTYVPQESIQPQSIQGVVTEISSKATLSANSVTLSAYNPEKASLRAISASATITEGASIDVMTFDEKARTTQELDRLSKIRAQELSCRKKIIRGRSYTAGIRSGYFVTIDKHFRGDINTKYLVTKVKHTATQAFASVGIKERGEQHRDVKTVYECVFEAIPSDTQFRATRKTAIPKIAGLLNARIDDQANSGDNSKSAIYQDGHYKVQPYFIKGTKTVGNGSSELRMLTPYAGGETGLQFGLRGNCEVLLAFINGDPDQPIIVGATFNSEDTSTLVPNNQSEHVIKTQSGLAVLFDDTSGKEKLTIFSQGSSIIIGRNGIGILSLENFTDDLFTLF